MRCPTFLDHLNKEMKVIVDLLITVNSLILVIAYQMFQQLQKAVNKMIREVILLICGLATISIVLLDRPARLRETLLQ